LTIVGFGTWNGRMAGAAGASRPAAGAALTAGRVSVRLNARTTVAAWRTAVASHAIGTALAASAWRSRCTARAWSCDTRDSFTPSSVPISFIVTSP
jgi:hypothetical protein